MPTNAEAKETRYAEATTVLGGLDYVQTVVEKHGCPLSPAVLADARRLLVRQLAQITNLDEELALLKRRLTPEEAVAALNNGRYMGHSDWSWRPNLTLFVADRSWDARGYHKVTVSKLTGEAVAYRLVCDGSDVKPFRLSGQGHRTYLRDEIEAAAARYWDAVERILESDRVGECPIPSRDYQNASGRLMELVAFTAKASADLADAGARSAGRENRRP